MTFGLENYLIEDADALLTPALLIYPEIVDANIRATLRIAGGDPNRWRPHIKTAKMSAVLNRYRAHGVTNFKCSTTLELSVACGARAADVLLAFPVMGANARAARQIADAFPGKSVSVLVESAEQARTWRGTQIGIFIDVNPGMNRTGIDELATAEIVELARKVGGQFRGVHYYDGHIAGIATAELKHRAHEGYDRLLRVVEALENASIRVEEVITSGTPATPWALSYEG
ncbi:MAG: alanine racemase, partial [Acidobacteriaceae bacterium]|nr:alanine racemase [Acidobacteriaceae bacterium]